MKSKTGYIILFLSAVAVIMLSLSIGATLISPFKIFGMISGDANTTDCLILLKLRIPRTIMALLIGASLSVSGVLFQALLRNPLSDPYTLGISGGAALGATIAVVLSLDYVFITLLAFTGSLAVILFVYTLSVRKSFSNTSLILTGVALSFIMSSGVLLIFALVSSSQVHKALLWLMGDLSIARYKILRHMSIIMPAIILISLFYHKHCNILSFGSAFAQNLGVTGRDVRNIFWIASLLAAISVSMAGIIGFIGLVVPHVMRLLFGPRHFALILTSAIGGALLLVLCDAAGRAIAPPYEIPVGIITGFFGGIFFLFLLISKGGQKI